MLASRPPSNYPYSASQVEVSDPFAVTAIEAVSADLQPVANLDIPLSELKQSIDKVDTDLVSQTAVIEEIKGIVQPFGDKLTNISGNLDVIRETTNVINGNVATIATKATSTDAAVQHISSTLDGLAVDITGVVPAIESVESELAAIEGTLSGMATELGLIGTGVGTIALETTAIAAETTLISGGVATIAAETTAVAASTAATAVSTAATAATLLVLEATANSIESNTQGIEDRVGQTNGLLSTVVGLLQEILTALQGLHVTIDDLPNPLPVHEVGVADVSLTGQPIKIAVDSPLPVSQQGTAHVDFDRPVQVEGSVSATLAGPVTVSGTVDTNIVGSITLPVAVTTPITATVDGTVDVKIVDTSLSIPVLLTGNPSVAINNSPTVNIGNTPHVIVDSGTLTANTAITAIGGFPASNFVWQMPGTTNECVLATAGYHFITTNQTSGVAISRVLGDTFPFGGGQPSSNYRGGAPFTEIRLPLSGGNTSAVATCNSGGNLRVSGLL